MSTVDDSNITQQPKVRKTGYESVTWPFASVSKRVFVQNLSKENEFELYSQFVK